MSTLFSPFSVDNAPFLCNYQFMKFNRLVADVTPDDKEILDRIHKILLKRQGKISFVSIWRLALRALDEKLRVKS